MSRLRRKFYNHLNITSNSENYEDEEPIDTDDQEDLINTFRTAQSNQSKLFINILCIIYMIPLPLYIMAFAKSIPILSFLAIISVSGSIISLKYVDGDGFIDGGSISDRFMIHHLERLPQGNRELWFLFFNNGISLICFLSVWNDWKKHLVFLIPLIVSVSSTILKKVIIHDGVVIFEEVDRLEKLKYKYKTI